MENPFRVQNWGKGRPNLSVRRLGVLRRRSGPRKPRNRRLLRVYPLNSSQSVALPVCYLSGRVNLGNLVRKGLGNQTHAVPGNNLHKKTVIRTNDPPWGLREHIDISQSRRKITVTRNSILVQRPDGAHGNPGNEFDIQTKVGPINETHPTAGAHQMPFFT